MSAIPLRSLLPEGPVQRGVLLLAPTSPFEAMYAHVRRSEGRSLNDRQVLRLPHGDGLWNASEWRIRAHSAARLARDLARRNRPLTILDAGCGNGWLSALLHAQGHSVVGMDVFTEELEQAARVFKGPSFARADLFHSPWRAGAFDAIIFAASFHYFPDVRATIERCFELLAPHGEVHVLDSILYTSGSAGRAARERSRTYYATVGVPEMAAFYHTHERSSLQAMGRTRVLSAPGIMAPLLRRCGRTIPPFTHLAIAPC